MPVQRKVFRIEEHMRPRAYASGPAIDTDTARGHREFTTELQTLRGLIEPRGESGRHAIERARARVAEARAYRHELGLIHAAVQQSRDEMAAIAMTPHGERTARARRELAAIVGSTEKATQSILQAAEEIDQAAASLSASLKSAHEQGLAQDIQERVVQIFEACNFQDLTGQRVGHVLVTLQAVEERVARLMAIWRDIEEAAPLGLGGDSDDDRALLDGPKLPNDSGHSSQNDIDAMFGRA